ncbi:putative Prokaryotic chromosome segregation/condensation protein ScpA protein [Trachipleistophora hominis]|uniref:Putative Prokaryotic chromosome segregation/condensation protein ScpA protein n=1 Tax=Trachipleistophora hominis TaxID=72359 RepID=L7JXQ4_TRAHO|nr:putative Prokaryotic chromosome segregation/condensation protein ScpA protein [Trachipleistophora hominis]
MKLDIIKGSVYKRTIKEDDIGEFIEFFPTYKDELITRVYFLHILSKTTLKFSKILNTEIKRIINNVDGNVLSEKRNIRSKINRKVFDAELEAANNLSVNNSFAEPDCCDIDFDNRNTGDTHIISNDEREIIVYPVYSNRLFKRVKVNLRIFPLKTFSIIQMITDKIIRTLGNIKSFNLIEEIRDNDTCDFVENCDSFEGTHLFSSSLLNSNMMNELEAMNIICFNEKMFGIDREHKVAAFCKLLELLVQNKVTVEQIDCYTNIYVYTR